MGSLDKDRHQKELAIRYCLARGIVPFAEVIVSNSSDLSETTEVLTDIDVLGIELVSDGDLRREIFDCKTSSRLSSINRAFWAAGVLSYTKSDRACVILKNRAVHNHKMSALSMKVDLHSEESFKDFGKTFDTAFPAETCYQSSIARWHALEAILRKLSWASSALGVARNVAPLTDSPSSTFRRLVADMRAIRGEIDPEKKEHVCLFLEFLAASLLLWVPMSRDARRFYDPQQPKADFEKTLRFYLWGGREAYLTRQQMRQNAGHEAPSPVEMPSWDQLLMFVGLVVSAPHEVYRCIHFVKEVCLREALGRVDDFDARLSLYAAENPRVRQFSLALSDYLVSACGLPRDMGKKVQSLLFDA